MTQISYFCAGFAVVTLLCAGVTALVHSKLFLLIFKNLNRNLLRTELTAAIIIVLVVMITLIWTVVNSLEAATEEQSQEIKLIVTERWQLPSQMPLTHAYLLDPED